MLLLCLHSLCTSSLDGMNLLIWLEPVTGRAAGTSRGQRGLQSQIYCRCSITCGLCVYVCVFVCLYASKSITHTHTQSCSDHGADIQPQSQHPCPKQCSRKVTPSKKKKKKRKRWERLIDGGLVMKWRHQGAWRGGEEGRVETTQKRGRKRKSEGYKKNSLSPVFHQGRNYTFTKVFS